MKAVEIKNENGSREIREEPIERDEFRIPNEAACSAEFKEGCIFSE